MKLGVSMVVMDAGVAVTGAVVTGAVDGVGCAGFTVLVGAVVAVVAVTAGFGGAGFFASSGKNFGATAAHNQSRPIEIRTAAKIRVSMSWDGVPTSRIERVATGQASQAEPDAAQRAVLLDRLHHVNRAGRLEAAHRRQQRRDEPLVETKKRQSDRAHHSSSGCALSGDLLQGALKVVAELFEARLGGVRL